MINEFFCFILFIFVMNSLFRFLIFKSFFTLSIQLSIKKFHEFYFYFQLLKNNNLIKCYSLKKNLFSYKRK